MLYEFECSCGQDWVEARRLADRLEPSICKVCGASVVKREIPSRTGGFTGASDWDTAHYNKALGKSFRNYGDARKFAKSQGLTEVGNENVDEINKKFENERKAKLDYDISQITSLGEINSK